MNREGRLPVRRALVSVFDKQGLDRLAWALAAAGVEVVSTGSTAAALQGHGLAVTRVEELTGFGELLDGRVKTLHPRVHAGLLADRSVPGHREALEAAGIAAFDLVAAARPDVVCLAGFMRILGPGFVRAFPDRIVNTHPSLLPAFRGAHAVRDALAYGVKVTGCTVHLVDEEVDHGPVLFQAAVPVEAGDDEDRLHERIKAEEHRLLPAAVRLLAEGRVRVEGRRARIPDPEEVSR